MEKGGLSQQERAMVITMVDVTKPNTLYEQAISIMMRIMTGSMEDYRILFKSNETFYIPSQGPKRYPQHTAAGRLKPQNDKPRLRAGRGTANLQVDVKKNSMKDGKVMLHLWCLYPPKGKWPQ